MSNFPPNPAEITDIPDSERTRCEIWTRCMGYFRPVSYFNTGKQQEHRDRKYFRECVAMETVNTLDRVTQLAPSLSVKTGSQYRRYQPLIQSQAA